MPRLPQTPGQPLTEILKTRLTETEITGIDKARGHLSRSEWNRNLIRGTLTTPKAAPLHSSEVRPHRHKRGKLLAEYGLKGQTHRTYECAEEGCTQELTS